MTRKVFIVEDNLILNLLYKSYMEQLGFEVTGELVRAEEAIQLARKANPDLILMDIALDGDTDGIQAIREIRLFSEVPVIYITGNSDTHHRKRAGETGFLDYLIKPISFEDLKSSIEKNIHNIQST